MSILSLVGNNPSISPGTMSVTVSPTFLTGRGFGNGTVQTLRSAVVTVLNPQGPVTYSWTPESNSITPITPNSSMTGFSSFLFENDSQLGVFSCIVSDGITTVQTEDVFVSLTADFRPGGGSELPL